MLALVHPSTAVDNSHTHSHAHPHRQGSTIMSAGGSSTSSTVVRPRSVHRKHSTTSTTPSSSNVRSSSNASANSSLVSRHTHPPAPTKQTAPTTNGRSSLSRSPTRSGAPSRPVPPPPPPPPISTTTVPTASEPRTPTSPPFDIHSYPSAELLRLLASLLTQIASTNDKLITPSTSPLSSHIHPHHSHSPTPSQSALLQSLTTASHTSLTSPTSALTFHARNIPTITLESYLLRILKYCPTTNEVFLSLLVYFDRMSKLAGEATGRTFVIDSFNVHRLVIAGVTVASKFFSDVFYTNSRYAKVGGLPQPELNQLELQFLLLNDFRLVISAEEMQRYAEQLIVFSESDGDGVSPAPAPIPTPMVLTTSHLPVHSASAFVAPSPSRAANGDAAAPMQAMGAIDAYGGRIVADGTENETYQSHLNSSLSSSGVHIQNGVNHNNKTPSFRPHIPGPYASASSPMPIPIPVPISTSKSRSTRAAPPPPPEDSESEAGTETETENETEGEWTTDDEPTIRPGEAGSRSGGRKGGSRGRGSGVEESESDCASLCSTGTEDGDGFFADGDEEGDEDRDEDGDDGGREVEIGDVHVNGTEGDTEVEGEGKGERTPEQRRGIGSLGLSLARGDGDGDYAMASP